MSTHVTKLTFVPLDNAATLGGSVAALAAGPTALGGHASGGGSAAAARSAALVRPWTRWADITQRRLLRRTVVWLYKRKRAGVRPADDWSPGRIL